MMGRKYKDILDAADLFCGAGGTTAGAEMSGRVRVVLAVNCWPTAIASHQRNHPNALHVCKRIEHVDPRHDKTLPEFDLLMASPECTHHSVARGGRPIDDQRRATPWDVLNWVSARRPRWLLVENVREFRDWGPLNAKCQPIKTRKGEIFQAWMAALTALGYQVDCQVLNAADFGAATKRLRLFIIARRGYSKRDIPWPNATHSKTQWRPAWSVIDWQKPCPSIFTRKRPLAEKTLRRIEIGLKKFCGPWVVRFNNHCAADSVADPLSTILTSGAHHGLAVPFQFKALGRNPGASRSIEEPWPTIVASQANHAVVMPFMLNYHGGVDPRRDGTERSLGVDGPIPVIPTENRYGLVQPFLVPHFGEREGQTPRAHGIDVPLPTVTGQGAGSLVMPFMLDVNHGNDAHTGDRVYDANEPLRTLSTINGKAFCLPFFTKYYGTGGASSVDEPLDVVTTRDRFGLAMASLLQTMQELSVVDIGFRMLDVDELARAQGFPEHYGFDGTKADQVRQVGNSVSPPVARALCETIAEAC